MAVLRLSSIMVFMLPMLNPAHAGSLADIDHVVLFMQENRAFDHYFGTMAGIRGFSDPNVQLNDGMPVWQQKVDTALATNASHLNPWYINYLGGHWLNATQCAVAGDNGWTDNQAALNFGMNDHWATNNTPYSWAHFRRSDIPVQFGIADGWTIGDMYQESVIASTNPNRVTWISGSINVPGSPQTSDQGGYPYIDNNETPGCDDLGINCYPLKWPTTGDKYEQAGVSWQAYQDADNFDDNPFAWFDQFQTAANTSSMYKRGFKGSTMATFYAQAANGTLPEISYIIGPAELSEHPPYSPRDGAWLQKKIVDAVTRSPVYSKTALIISYDETGGWGDHVTPYHSPEGTAGEWLDDPFSDPSMGTLYSGPGFRLPFYIVSPWTRGGAVFTEHADHNSQILFLEAWQAAKGKNVTTDEMSPWRREHMSDLTAAFDFANPDLSIPSLPKVAEPHTDAKDIYDGSSYCEATYSEQEPPVPYADQVENVSTLSEDGFKEVRGKLTEGRYLVFEMKGVALANIGSENVTAAIATTNHESKKQRWVVQILELGGDEFTVISAVDGRFIGGSGSLDVSEAATYTVTFEPGQGYALRSSSDSQWLVVSEDGAVAFSTDVVYWKAYSVTYHT